MVAESKEKEQQYNFKIYLITEHSEAYCIFFPSHAHIYNWPCYEKKFRIKRSS